MELRLQQAHSRLEERADEDGGDAHGRVHGEARRQHQALSVLALLVPEKVQILTLKAVHQQADGGGGGEYRQGVCAPLNLLAVLVHKYWC